MNDLMILSWNVEQKSYNAFLKKPDTVERLVKGVVDAVKKGDNGVDTPFIGFLLEIKGAKPKVDLMSNLLTAEFEKQTGRRAVFEAYATGGASTTAESIIVMHRGVNVDISSFDVQENMREFVKRDKSRADDLAEQHDAAVSLLGLRNRDQRKVKRYTPYDKKKQLLPEEKKQRRYREVARDADWFRNGVIADITHGANKIKVASMHAPGPNFSNKVPAIVDTMIGRAASAGVDVLIGDFNRHGVYGGANYDDITEKWTTGTSFKRKGPAVLSESRWDRVLAKKGRTFNIVAEDPIPIIRPEDLGLGRLTDHALISARVSDAPTSVSNLLESPKVPELPPLGTSESPLLSSKVTNASVSRLVDSPPLGETPLRTESSVSEGNPLTNSEEMDLVKPFGVSPPRSDALTPPVSKSPLVPKAENMEVENLLAQLPPVPTVPSMSAEELALQLPSAPKTDLVTSTSVEETAALKELLAILV